MNNYQKAIKVRKVCETQAYCNINGWNCPYKNYCQGNKRRKVEYKIKER